MLAVLDTGLYVPYTAAAGGGPITFVKSNNLATAQVTGNQTVSFAAGASSTTGNFLVSLIASKSTDTTNNTLATPTGWSLARSELNASTNCPKIYIFYRENAPASTGITVNYAGAAAEFCLTILEYSGIATSASLDKVASASDSVGTTTVSSGTTAATVQADELVIALLANRFVTASQSAWTNSFTQRHYFTSLGTTNTNNENFSANEKIVAATGTQTTAATLSSARAWAGAIATFKKAP